MFQKKILVPLVSFGKGLKSVHYALSLAERLQSQVYILQQAPCANNENQFNRWFDENLLDLINSARLSGLSVSHHITHRELKDELVELVMDEDIDLLIFGTGDGLGEHLLLQIKPLISTQIIQVKEKNHVSYL